MIPDRLFDAALAYKQAKLWRKLYDSEIFGVRFADGEVGYCCVMGKIGELTALAVYPGQTGLDSMRRLTDDADGADMLDRWERMHGQDCLMLSLETKDRLLPRDREEVADYCRRKGVALRGPNAYPHFERFRPGRERWYLEDAEDQRRMLDGLEAACEVARALGGWRKGAA